MNVAGHRVQRGIAGRQKPFGKLVAAGEKVRRNVEMESIVAAAGRRRCQRFEYQGDADDRELIDRRAVGQFGKERLRRDGIERRNTDEFRIGVGEFEREDLVDELLCIGWNLGRRNKRDDALAVNDGLRARLVHRSDRQQRQFVEQNVFA